MKKRALSVLKVLVSAGLIFLLYRRVDLGELWTVIRQVRPMVLVLLFGLLFVNTVLSSLKWQILLRMELPLAFPVMFAGIRTATVINVGTAALATFIAGGGLGDIIREGMALNRSIVFYTGGITTALLAITIDWIGEIVEARVSPPTR